MQYWYWSRVGPSSQSWKNVIMQQCTMNEWMKICIAPLKPSSQRHLMQVSVFKKPHVKADLNCNQLMFLSFRVDGRSFHAVDTNDWQLQTLYVMQYVIQLQFHFDSTVVQLHFTAVWRLHDLLVRYDHMVLQKFYYYDDGDYYWYHYQIHTFIFPAVTAEWL